VGGNTPDTWKILEDPGRSWEILGDPGSQRADEARNCVEQNRYKTSERRSDVMCHGGPLLGAEFTFVSLLNFIR